MSSDGPDESMDCNDEEEDDDAVLNDDVRDIKHSPGLFGAELSVLAVSTHHG